MWIFHSLLGILILVSAKASSPVNFRTLIEQTSSDDETYRLSRLSEPLSYQLFLNISDENFYSYRGSVEIEMRYLSTSNVVYLSSAGLIIDRESFKLTKPDGASIPLAQLITVERQQILYLGFAERLQLNEIYKMHIEFSNTIDTDLKGLYRSSYRVGNQTRYIATTHFESTYARMVFPCYDEPSYKAYFNISIYHRSRYHALSNMPVKEKTPDGDQFTITHFQTSPFMSSYLVAFIVSDYVTLASNDDLIRVYAPENQVENTKYATDFARKSLRHLEDMFGHSFQLPKVDLVAIPDFNMGAMENWGLISFRAVYLIYDEAYTTARTKQNIADLITHEFVHSWFGNEVTPEWWTHLWLSEGFARYFEYYVTSQIETEWRLWEQFVVNNVHSALSQDDKAGNRPMSFFATQPDILNSLFDYVVYAKSASVIRMIQNVIGFDVFKMALNDYIRNRSYQMTNPDYLYESIEKFIQSPVPHSVKAVFDSWADNAGYPVIKVTKNGKYVTFAQKRFWTPVHGETAPKDNKFYVPLNFATSEEVDFEDTSAVDWLTPDIPEITKELPSAVDWILVNKQQTGYYRVNYDSDNWATLNAFLNSDNGNTIPVINRAQLVDDVANLAKAGEISYAIAFSLLKYLERETEYIPWSTAYNALIHLNRLFSSNLNYSRFKDFIRKITVNIYNGIRLSGNNDHISRLHRGNTVYLACYFGVKACLDDAQKMIQQMLNDELYIIPEESQSAAFCAINKHNTILSESLLKLLFDRYLPLRNSDSGLIGRFISGMGCNRNVTMIGYYLGLTITNLPGFQLTGVERNQIFVGVLSGSYEGLRESLNFMHQNYPDVSYMFNSVANIFVEYGNRINSQETLEALKSIVTKYNSTFTDSVKYATQSALVQAERNVVWVNEFSSSIGDWLIENEYTMSTTTNKPDGGGASSIAIGYWLATVMITITLIR